MRAPATGTWAGAPADDAPPDVVAAGAVLWRPGPDGAPGPGPEVALVHRPRYDDWSLPKGKLEPGESTPAAAVREVAEETGTLGTLGVRLGESHYPVPQGHKAVHYWAARAAGVVPGGFVPGHEVDQLRWLPLAAAEERLSYPRDQEILRRFGVLAPDGRPPVPVLLVRHAKAGNRERWTADDDLRPLSAKGRDQAAGLVELLTLFGPRRVYAAPPVRCPETVRPLAEHLGVDIVVEPSLGEEGYWRDPGAGQDRLREIAAGPGPAVVCSQGGVIPDLVERLYDRDDPPSAKASTWVLGLAEGATSPADLVVTADYYRPPG